MEKKDEKKKTFEKISEDLRFKYIGFEIYPKSPKEFWKNEEEKRRYLEEVRRKGSRSILVERDHSLVRVKVFSSVDRMVLTIASFLLTVSFFLPWFSLRGQDFGTYVLGFGFFLKLGTLFGYAPLSGAFFSLFVILVGLTILSSFGAGLISLLAIHRKRNDEESYLNNLKKRLKLNLIPLVLWIALIITSIIGIPTPFADSLRVDGFGDHFNVINFFALSSYGIWLSLPSVIINCAKISDL